MPCPIALCKQTYFGVSNRINDAGTRRGLSPHCLHHVMADTDTDTAHPAAAVKDNASAAKDTVSAIHPAPCHHAPRHVLLAHLAAHHAHHAPKYRCQTHVCTRTRRAPVQTTSFSMPSFQTQCTKNGVVVDLEALSLG